MEPRTFKFVVEAELQVEAFEFSDALEVVESYFEDQFGELVITARKIKHK